MWEQDLKTQANLPESDDDFENNILKIFDVIKLSLPLPILIQKQFHAPQFIFGADECPFNCIVGIF